MTGWAALETELDAWQAAGRRARLWWRDDDARGPSAALDRLLDIAGDCGVPLALAVIPAGAGADLAAALAGHREVAVLQHGYAHQNHAGPGDKKTELGPHRPFEQTLAEIATGWQRLENLFESDSGASVLLPVMVPPWNRIAPRLVPMLPELRFAGLSAFGPRIRAEAVPGLRQVNTHIDLIDWPGRRGFVGLEAALGAAIAHLSARRAGSADGDEPTGLLSHHLAHDEESWRFIAEFLRRTAAHPAVEWMAAAALFTGAAP